MKKPVKRVILLEEALSDLMEAEYILSTIESRDVFQSFTDTQKRHYHEVLSRLRDLTHDISQDTSQEQLAS